MPLAGALQQPHGLPSGTWRSPQFQAVAHSVDAYCLLLTTLNNFLVLTLRFAKRSSHVPTALAPAFATVVLICLLTILLGVLQLLLCHTHPTIYFRHRPYMLLAARLLRLWGCLEWLLQMRAWFAAPGLHARIAVFSATNPLPSKLAGALNTLLIFSGALYSVANTVTVPLPLLPQVPFLLLYLVVMLKYHARIAAEALALSPYSDTLQEACLSLNSVVAMSASAHSGHIINLHELHEACRRDSALLLVVFAQLFFGTVVPLYCSVRVDQEVRQHVQHALQRARQGVAAALQARPRQQQPPAWGVQYPPRPLPPLQQAQQPQRQPTLPPLPRLPPAPPRLPPPQQQRQPAQEQPQEEQQQQQLLGDAGLLLMLAATCWLTAVSFLPELVQLSLPTLDRLLMWYKGLHPL